MFFRMTLKESNPQTLWVWGELQKLRPCGMGIVEMMRSHAKALFAKALLVGREGSTWRFRVT